MVKHLFLLDSGWLDEKVWFMRWFYFYHSPLLPRGWEERAWVRMLQFSFSYIRYNAVLACRIFDRRELEQVYHLSTQSPEFHCF